MNNTKRILLATLASTLCAILQAEPLALDTSSLTNDWNEAGISAWRCGAAFKDFGKAVADANAAAVAQRAKLGTTARVYLKQQLEKAQTEGSLDKVLVFKNALESARGGEIVGDDESIAKLRDSYGKQLVLADKALVTAGLTAARALSGTLEWQKTEVTKKGDIADAQKIVVFQKKVEEWAKSIQTQTGQNAIVQTVAAQPVATLHPQPKTTKKPLEPISGIKRLESETKAKIVTVDARKEKGSSIGKVREGETIEIQYIGGKWHSSRTQPVVSPDAERIDGNLRCLLEKRGKERLIVAEIPPGSAEEPYTFTVDEEMAGEYCLRIRKFVSWDGGQGAVRYSVRIIPAQQPSPDVEGR